MEIKYKFKDLKTFSSTETLEGNTKKYRRVFDNLETTYLYAELSFYNKLFDEEDWTANILLKAYSIKGTNKKELCSIQRELEISKDQNIVIIREGWGNKEPGAYWLRSDYEWEAFIDGESVGIRKFHIENGGPVSPTENPYFQLESIRLFEGSDQGIPLLERNYLKKFKADETRYVWLECNFINIQGQPWYAEIFFNFYNDTGQLKGNTSELKYLETKDQYVTLTSGWGSNIKGTWYHDKYTLEIVFMDQLIAVIPFAVGDEFEEGISEFQLLPDSKLEDAEPQSAKEESLEEVMSQLNTMIGLADIKNKINDYIHYLKFLKLRKEQGFEEDQKISLHSVFLGNPGTGKTTIAKMLGQIYKKMGLLSKGKVTEVGRAELVGKFIGQTAPQVKEVIEKARGGILFIDEAYSLLREGDNAQDFGQEVIEVLLKEMSDGPGDIAIIVAGYPKEMNFFLNSNPGLKSRFNLYYHFEDYLPQELMKIAEHVASSRSVYFTEDANAFLYTKLTETYRNRDKSFGNARLVNSIVDEAKVNMGLRLMKTPKEGVIYSSEELKTVHKIDIEQIFKQNSKSLPDIQIDDQLLNEALEDLNSLVGLEEVKNDVTEMIKLVRFYRETKKEVLNKFSLHSVFIGNPGTGKTTVARIIAKVYKALGVLERGHLVEVDRQALVAGFIGQTAIKTSTAIKSAEGGILFIDEAYTLASGTENDFGREAIETLLKQMEDKRGEFVVVVAGYTNNMKQFLESNPGLKSRFDQTLNFQDYNQDDLFMIALKMLEEEGLELTKEAAENLKQLFEHKYQSKDNFFGNAREARKIVKEAVKNQHLRMASLKQEARTSEALKSLELVDLKSLNNENTASAIKGQAIGFKIINKESNN